MKVSGYRFVLQQRRPDGGWLNLSSSDDLDLILRMYRAQRLSVVSLATRSPAPTRVLDRTTDDVLEET